jgi:hypothetical protein
MFKGLPNMFFTFSVKYGYNVQNSLDMLTHSNYKTLRFLFRIPYVIHVSLCWAAVHWLTHNAFGISLTGGTAQSTRYTVQCALLFNT